MHFSVFHQIAFWFCQELVVGLHPAVVQKNPTAKCERVLNCRLPTWQELIAELNAVVFLSGNGERRLCVCVQTQPADPSWSPQPLALFVLAIRSVAGAKGFYCCGGWIPAHAFPGPAAPLIVVLSQGVCLRKPYLIPPKALQAIQMLTPWAQTTLRAARLGAQLPDEVWCSCVCKAGGCWLCHRGWSTCLGRGPRGQGRWKAGGTRRGRRRVWQLLVSARG